MEIIEINTGLDGFVMVDRILPPAEEAIQGMKCFTQAPLFQGMEALAQLAALHQRWRMDFQRHAFLLSVQEWTPPALGILDGEYRLEAVIQGESQAACSYGVQAENPAGEGFGGTLTIAWADYGKDFPRNPLQDHYQRVFQCLLNGSEIN